MGFQQGLSGLNASSKALDAVGNNIANSGTVGFKGARGEFADVFAASLAGAGASQIGVGVTLANVAQQFTQGNITTTNNSLDVAINGGGFFRMSNNGAVSYTRNGQFQLDKNGYVVNAGGYRLTGYKADYATDPAGIIVPSTPDDIFIDPSDLTPKATSTVTVGLNLDSRKEVPTAVFNTANPLSYNSSTSVTTYDTLGNPHVFSMYFVKTNNVPAVGASSWNVYASTDGTPITNVNMGMGFGAPMSIEFDTSGKLVGINGAATTAVLPPISINLDQVVIDTGNAQVPPVVMTNDAAPTIDFDFNILSSTQFGSAFGINQMTQNGFSSGRLAGLSISADGVIQGKYSNGQSRNMGQIVLAKFNNPNGLLNMGGNQWQETSASGQPLVGAPGSGSNGVVQAGSVEESNTDLTAELVNMITQQRAYQANAQTIKTQDQIMQTLVNLR